MGILLLEIQDHETLEIDENMLVEFWQSFFGESSEIGLVWGKRNFIDYFKSLVHHEGPEASTLFLKTKAFKISLSGNIIKSGLVSAFLASALWYYGCQDIPKTVILGVLGSLFVIERVELKKSDKLTVARIPVRKKKGRYLRPENWYEVLPEDIKAQMNYLSFVDFLERLELAGFAGQKDGKYLIFEKGKNKLKIHFV